MALTHMSANRIAKRAGLLLWILQLLACTDGIAAEQYRVLSGDSELRVLVFRAGALATLGHNHVISSNALAGTVLLADTPADGAFDLHLPVDSLVVDDPDVRAEEGSAFSVAVSEKDRAGTRRNMMGAKLLQGDRFADIRVTSQRISGSYPDVLIEAEVTIRGKKYIVELPVIVERYDDRVVVTGSKDISHSDLGLTPFTAAFGTMRVGDPMTFKYRIAAVRGDRSEQ
jgi:CO/xanthine dehydrogenase Mo-binding subunit